MTIPGWLFEAEGDLLFEVGCIAADIGPLVEVGSYCGKSTVRLGAAAQLHHNFLLAVDPHRGNPEMQPGHENYDFLVGTDSLPFLRRNIELAGLDGTVIPVVGKSLDFAPLVYNHLGLVFIDAAHDYASVLADVTGWECKVALGGFLALHDASNGSPADAWEQLVRGQWKDRWLPYAEAETLRVARRV